MCIQVPIRFANTGTHFSRNGDKTEYTAFRIFIYYKKL